MSSGSDAARPATGRALWAGLGTLLFAMAAHAILETTRDTLFLRDLPASRLPLAYLAMAIGTGAAAFVQSRLGHRTSRARLLGGTLVVGAIGVGAFVPATRSPEAPVLFGLYVFTGVLSSAVVLQLWLAVGEVFRVDEAKQAFARIAAGGLVGAVAGAVAASLLLEQVEPRGLLPVASLLLLAGAATASQLGGSPRLPDPEPNAATREHATLRELAGDRYAVTILVTLMLATVLANGVDLVFKTSVAAAVPRGELGPFFARFYAVVNGLALAVQLCLAGWLLQRLGVVRSLLVMPSLVGAGAAGLALVGGLAPALIARAGDGVLRHSLHRAGSEILFLPLSPPARERLRGVTASFGHRGAQALASLLLLLALSMGASLELLAAGVALCAVGVVASVLSLRSLYVARFRERIRSLRNDAEGAVPRLDLGALETLVAQLASPDDQEVLAALDLLEAYDRLTLVPPLLLYHPSPEVVLRSIDRIGARRPEAVRDISRRLVDHADARVRAAALHWAELTEPELRERLADPSDAVRGVAITRLLDGAAGASKDRIALLQEIAEQGSEEAQHALALSGARLPAALREPLLRRLLASGSPRLREAVARGLASEPERAPLPLLLELLAHREARPHVRAALLARRDALGVLGGALRSEQTPAAVRRHLPRTISRMRSQVALGLLTDVLRDEADPVVRYKILRGLGRMRADDPALEIDEEILLRFAEDSLARARELHAARAALLARHRAVPMATSDLQLVDPLLREKVDRALERVFRALHILAPQEIYEAVFAGLRSGGDLRASARELLEHVAQPRLQPTLGALVGPGEPEECLRACASDHPAVTLALAVIDDPTSDTCWLELLGALQEDHDPILRAVIAAAGLARPIVSSPQRSSHGAAHGV